MTISPQSLALRAKKLGVLLKDARQSANKTPEECGALLGVELPVYLSYELGDTAPSMPEIELLAHSFNVPLDHFWTNTTLPKEAQPQSHIDVQRLIALRQRMIGAQLRLARVQTGFSLERLAEKTGLAARQIETWELGEVAVTIPELEILAGALNRPIRDFQDQNGPVGTWAMQVKASAEFMKMPPELQNFVSKPINRPYLELALRLSEMSVDRLRSVAEGLLEITL